MTAYPAKVRPDGRVSVSSGRVLIGPEGGPCCCGVGECCGTTFLRRYRETPQPDGSPCVIGAESCTVSARHRPGRWVLERRMTTTERNEWCDGQVGFDIVRQDDRVVVDIDADGVIQASVRFETRRLTRNMGLFGQRCDGNPNDPIDETNVVEFTSAGTAPPDSCGFVVPDPDRPGQAYPIGSFSIDRGLTGGVIVADDGCQLGCGDWFSDGYLGCACPGLNPACGVLDAFGVVAGSLARSHESGSYTVFEGDGSACQSQPPGCVLPARRVKTVTQSATVTRELEPCETDPCSSPCDDPCAPVSADCKADDLFAAESCDGYPARFVTRAEFIAAGCPSLVLILTALDPGIEAIAGRATPAPDSSDLRCYRVVGPRIQGRPDIIADPIAGTAPDCADPACGTAEPNRLCLPCMPGPEPVAVTAADADARPAARDTLRVIANGEPVCYTLTDEPAPDDTPVVSPVWLDGCSHPECSAPVPLYRGTDCVTLQPVAVRTDAVIPSDATSIIVRGNNRCYRIDRTTPPAAPIVGAGTVTYFTCQSCQSTTGAGFGGGDSPIDQSPASTGTARRPLFGPGTGRAAEDLL